MDVKKIVLTVFAFFVLGGTGNLMHAQEGNEFNGSWELELAQIEKYTVTGEVLNIPYNSSSEMDSIFGVFQSYIINNGKCILRMKGNEYSGSVDFRQKILTVQINDSGFQYNIHGDSDRMVLDRIYQTEETYMDKKVKLNNKLILRYRR